MATILMHFKQAYPEPITMTLGDTLILTGSNTCSNSYRYIYQMRVAGVLVGEVSTVGSNLQTGLAPERTYEFPDSVCALAVGQSIFECEITHLYRYIFDESRDQILDVRVLYVRITDAEVGSFAAIESAQTQAIQAQFGSFVQGRSHLRYLVSAQAPQGSTILRADVYAGADDGGELVAGAFFEGGEQALSERALPEDLPVSGHGELMRTLVLTDARGRQVKQTLSLYVLAYQPPSIQSFEIARADASGAPASGGSYVRAQLAAQACSIQVGGVEKNAATLKVRARPVAGGAWAEQILANCAGYFQLDERLSAGLQCLQDQSYQFELLLTDYFSTAALSATLGQVYRLLNLHEGGKALAVGKYATVPNLMDVALPARFAAAVTMDDAHAKTLALDQPLGPASGGTGVSTLAALKQQLGVGEPYLIRRGQYSFTCAASSSNVTFTIYYGETFAATPVVQCTLQLNTGYNTITYAIGYVSQNYFQFVISNTTATARACVMHWTAVAL